MARFRTNPLWSRAPLTLLRFPPILVSLAGASVLLALAIAVGPLFLSATAEDGLHDALRKVGPFGAGYSIVSNEPIDPSYRQRTFLVGKRVIQREQNFEIRDERLTAAFAEIDRVGPRVATVMGDEVTASADNEVSLPVRPIARTDAIDHVHVLSSVPGDGVLLPDIIAEGLDVHPGDAFRLGTTTSTHPVRVRVKGIYRALSEVPFTPYWFPLANEIQLQLPEGILPPPFVIASREQATEIIEALTPRDAQFRWEFPVEDIDSLSLADALTIRRSFNRITSEIGQVESRLGVLFSCHCYIRAETAELTTGIDLAVRSASNREGGLEDPLGLISNAGAVIALALLGATAMYEVHRRNTEIVYLMVRGVRASVIGLRAVVEAILPVCAGLVVGYFGARSLTGVVLPGTSPGSDVVAEATRRLEIAAVVAGVVICGGAALGAARRMRRAWKPVGRGFGPPWEIPVIALAVYGLLLLMRADSLIEGGSSGREINSGLILLFPLALIGGISGIVARIFRRVLARARARSRHWADGPHLAVHRLAAAPQLAILLFSACGLALGTLVYSQTTGTTIQMNATTKAYVFVGSDVGVPTNPGSELPPSFPFPWTVTSQVLDSASIAGDRVDVVAIDADTVARAAYWDDSFSDVPLNALADDLDEAPADGVNVATTGGFDDGAPLAIGDVDIPIHPTHSLSAFPGMEAGRSVIVVDSERLRAALSDAGGQDVVVGSSAYTQLWIKGDPASITRALTERGFPVEDILTARSVLEQPVFVAIRRSFAFLQILGLTSSLVVLVGLVLYLQARQAQRTLSLALAARMGLTRRSHQSALLIELGTMLVIALIVGGGVGVGVSSLLFSRLDPLPAVAPVPSLFLPVIPGIGLVVALAVITVAGAIAADRAARRASVVEVLRYE